MLCSLSIPGQWEARMGTACRVSTFTCDHLAFFNTRDLVSPKYKSLKKWSSAKASTVKMSVQLQQRSVRKAFQLLEVVTLFDSGNNSGNHNSNNNHNNNGGNGNNNGGSNNHGEDGSQDEFDQRRLWLRFLSVLGLVAHFHLDTEAAFGRIGGKGSLGDDEEIVWEIRGSKWSKYIADPWKDQFVFVGSSSSPSEPSLADVGNGEFKSLTVNFRALWSQCKDLFMHLMLPEGYPDSVTSDYLDYSIWRAVQGIASQMNGVLATQSLLYAVGLGKGAIPTAAAINWVLKDGIGYLSKIYLSNFGRHFDVHPKGWRLFADLLENAALGLEMLTPAFPHLFVFIGAAAGAGRSAATLIQAATRSCFFAGFAAKRNFAEVIAKGEAQGMVSKFIGIMLGIGLANSIGSSPLFALASFGVVTWVHMYCNLKSYQSIQLRTLNPYRASLIFSEYLLSGQVPPIRDVNDEEPFFPAVPLLTSSLLHKHDSVNLSPEAKAAAAEIEKRLELGSSLSDVVHNREDAAALLNLFSTEGYILTEHNQKFCVILKESASPQDMLKSLFHVNYLFWLENNAGIAFKGAVDECRAGGKLQISLEYVEREFNLWKADSGLVGWVTDGLVARPLPCRIRVNDDTSDTGN